MGMTLYTLRSTKGRKIELESKNKNNHCSPCSATTDQPTYGVFQRCEKTQYISGQHLKIYMYTCYKNTKAVEPLKTMYMYA